MEREGGEGRVERGGAVKGEGEGGGVEDISIPLYPCTIGAATSPLK